MQYRRLGKTELSVSTIGIGTWQFSGLWGKQFEQKEVDEILSRASELGINFIDTAECYGPDHLAEQFIGNSIGRQRERWIVATKFGHNNDNSLGEGNYRPEQVLIQLEDSLRALQTDYIDIYQLHSAEDPIFDNDKLWTMLDKQVQAGKVRFLGNSIGRPDMQHQLKKSPEFGISVIQTAYNVIKPRAAKVVLPLAQELDLGVIARAPLAMGLLCGNYQPGHVFGADDVRSIFARENLDRDLGTAQEALKGKPSDMDPATWASAWCLRQPQIGTVIPGSKTVLQLEASALAGSITL